MSVLYNDLPLTAFPGDIDSFTTWLDIIASDGALVLQYQQAMQAGNTVLANQILAQIPSATQKIIKATDLNKMTQAILAVERFYKTDVEPYIQEQQANWLEIIHRFSYKGEWASGTTYEVNNFVSYTVSGATLIYLATSNPPVGTPPTNTNYWRLLSIQGQQGPSGEGVSYRQEWNSSAQYYTDDTVTYGGALWIATQNSQGQTPQSGSQYWQLVMSLGLTTYPIQDSEPTGQEVGGLWFNTQVNPTNYYQLAALENPATAAQISAGYEAYNDDGEVITGTQSMDDYLRTDGTNAMTGRLQANAGISSPSGINSYIYELHSRTITNVGGNFLALNTSDVIRFQVNETTIVTVDDAELDMNNNRIANLADGTSDTDAATVGQVNESIQAQMGTTGLVYPSAVSPDDQFTFNGLMVRVNTTVSNDMDIDANATMNFTALWNWWTNSETLQTGSAIYFAGGNTEIPISYDANNSKWQVVGSGTNYPRQGMLMLFTGAYL